METSGFFTSKIVDGAYDRSYTAEQFARYFAMFIGNGIFAGGSGLAVSTASDGMKVNVEPGKAWINGYWYENDSVAQVELNIASGTQDRIDAVVLQWSSIDRSIKLVAKKGTPASSPVNPTPDRNADVYELCIAYIRVPKGSTTIRQSNIVDVRLDSDVCGIVGALAEQWDVSQYGAQLNGYIKEYMAAADDSYEGFVASLNEWLSSYKSLSQSEFTTWFDSVKGQLSEDAAGHLQVQVDDINGRTRMSVYTSLKDIGLEAPVDCQTICSAMPKNSMLVLEVLDGTVVEDLPSTSLGTSGILTVRVMQEKYSMLFSSGDCLWIGVIITSGVNWKLLAKNDEVAVTLKTKMSISCDDDGVISVEEEALRYDFFTTKEIVEANDNSLRVLVRAESILLNRLIDGLSSKQDKLTDPLIQSDVVNSLNNPSTTKPLSAAMGKELNDKVSAVKNFVLQTKTQYVNHSDNYMAIPIPPGSAISKVYPLSIKITGRDGDLSGRPATKWYLSGTSCYIYVTDVECDCNVTVAVLYAVMS